MEETLISYFKQFEIMSLSKAVYAITSWPSNRGYVGSVDTVNRCLLRVEENCGEKHIDTYDSFSSFFIEVRSIIEDTLRYYESFQVDTGEVKFLSNNNYKRIIVGNGSEDIYETCFFINDLVEHDIELKDIWKEILDYENNTISLIYNNNIDNNYEFSLPSEDYFENIKIIFHKLKNNQLYTFFSPIKSINMELYSFFTPKNGFPIFLPLMKEVFIEVVEKCIKYQTMEDKIFRTLIETLNNNYYSTYNLSSNFGYSIRINPETFYNTEIILKNSIIIWHDQNIKIFLSSKIDKKNIDCLLGELAKEHPRISVDTAIGSGMLNFSKETNVEIFYIDCTHLSPSHPKFFTSINILTPATVIGIINGSSSIEEIVEFYNYLNHTNKNPIRVLASSGLLGYFQSWKDMDRLFIEGSANIQSIIMEPYTSVNRIIYQFSEEYRYFPFLLDNKFPGIHFWNLNQESISDLSLESKSNSVIAEVFCDKNKYIILRQFNSVLNDLGIDENQYVQSFNEVVMNSLYEYKGLLLSSLSSKSLDINVVSDEIFKRNILYENYFESKYFEHVTVFSNQECQRVLLKPKWNLIFNDNINSKNKEFENDLIIDLLSSILFKNKECLISNIKKSDDNKRKTLFTNIEIQYFTNENYRFNSPDDISFKIVRKKISKIIKSLNLNPGIYQGMESLELIKTFRKKLHNDLQKSIKRLNLHRVHIKLTMEYSALILEIDLHTKRLSTFSSDENLDELKLKEFREKTIELREKARRYKEIIEYLLEENLATNRNVNRPPTDRDIKSMIAYSKWLMDFQNISDAIHHGAGNWYALEILDDFRIDIIETEQFEKDTQIMSSLKYKFRDYAERDYDYDSLMFNKFEENFFKDTGVQYSDLIITLVFLSRNDFVNIFLENDTSISYINSLKTSIGFLTDIITEKEIIDVDKFIKALEFITIETDSIHDKSGAIPVWEKKKRIHKISAQPILLISNELIYSPAAVYSLKSQWTDGIMNFTLPYNSGLDNTLKVLDEWKTFYEKKIVDDLFKLFSSPRYLAYKDQELYKLDKKGNHPRDLGDYDLIVIDLEEKVVQLFEVKYMRMSFTIKDSIGGDQETYFTGRKAKALQFVKRTEYFEDNFKTILQNLGHEYEFTIEKYFITNKNIRSLFRDYPFQIMSFNEFKLTKIK